MKRILVTGAAGFLGRHLVCRLIDEGAEVRAVLRPGGSRLPAEWASCVKGVDWDLREPRPPQGIFDGIDVAFHLAARYAPGYSDSVLSELREQNVLPVANLIDACLRAGVPRLVHLSSIAACESSSSPVITERNGMPSSSYGRAKLEGEDLVRSARRDGFAWTILRPTAMYGEHGRGTVAEISRAILAGRFAIFGDGSNPVNFSYVGNVADALLHCAKSSAASAKTYIVADDNVTLREFDARLRRQLALTGNSPRLPVWLGYGLGALMDGVSNLTGRKMPLSVARVRAATANRIYSGSSLRIETGFQPGVSLDEALSRTVQWYRQSGVLG
jgi:nucleoside-diphosphate-sugar epimerase